MIRKGQRWQNGKGDYGKGSAAQEPKFAGYLLPSGERPGKCVRISKETEVQEDENSLNSSNKMPEAGAMNYSSKVMRQWCSDSKDEGSFSVITAGHR